MSQAWKPQELPAKLLNTVARARQILMRKPRGSRKKKAAPSQPELKPSLTPITTKLPTFKPSKRFLGRFDLPCLVASIQNSRLPGVAARHIAENKNVPTCKIYLRGRNRKRISRWQQENLDRLFLNEGLAKAIEEAMKEFGKDPDAYMESERVEIKRYGAAPFVYLTTIVIDEIQNEVILSGGSYLGTFVEHGLSIYLSKGRWRWDVADYFIHYQAGFQEVPELTPAEMVALRAKEMRKMARKFEALISGPKEEKRRWEKLFPAPPPGAKVETDASVIYCDWKLDPVETASVLTKLGEKTSVAKAREEWGNYVYRISRKTLKTLQGDDLIDEQPFRECRRRRNRFDFVIHADSIWEHWFDGKVLVDQSGLAYRRA